MSYKIQPRNFGAVFFTVYKFFNLDFSLRYSIFQLLFERALPPSPNQNSDLFSQSCRKVYPSRNGNRL